MDQPVPATRGATQKNRLETGRGPQPDWNPVAGTGYSEYGATGTVRREPFWPGTARTS